MNEHEWRQERDSRTLRYAGRRLDPELWVTVTCDPAYIESYSGQVAAITLVNLLARMTPAVGLRIPSVPIVEPLPWASSSLPDLLLRVAYAADPYGRFHDKTRTDGYPLHLGANGLIAVHGAGWKAYAGPSPSPLDDTRVINPFGAAFAAVLACAHLFTSDHNRSEKGVFVDTLHWSSLPRAADVSSHLSGLDLGTVWAVGAGSVGTAILFFLTLITRGFAPLLLDPDWVKIHNLDRSPIFADRDVGRAKVEVVSEYLRSVGVAEVQTEQAALHEANLWRDREKGTPDLLFAAANEFEVRYHIEATFPPIQVYGTTGRNWQATVLRHVPFVDPCSLCLFPPGEARATTRCATDAPRSEGSDDGVEAADAALPFLSFAAGLMAAAEVVKLQLPGFPFSPNRVVLYTRPGPRLVPAAIAGRARCLCSNRSRRVHQDMLAGTRLASLSGA